MNREKMREAVAYELFRHNDEYSKGDWDYLYDSIRRHYYDKADAAIDAMLGELPKIPRMWEGIEPEADLEAAELYQQLLEMEGK